MPEVVAIIHNLRSLHNVGSIFRTGDAAGVRKIYLTGITPAPVDGWGKIRPQFSKVALGAEKYVEWEKKRRFADAFRKLRGEGYKIFAVEQNRNSILYSRVGLRAGDKVALVVGSEIEGLPPAVLRRCDKILEIPMRGALVSESRHPRRRGSGKESLNVGVAFGVVVYHLMGKYKKHN